MNDVLGDESDLINLGFDTNSFALSYNILDVAPSLMADYPLNYKFFGVEISSSPTRKVF
jgi:hypothetical protein